MAVSERKHGLSSEPVPVSAYVGGSKNLKDLNDLLLLMKSSAQYRDLSSTSTFWNEAHKGNGGGGVCL